ncbi:MAG: DUF4384 domain-containing protein [Deltaproteobacteria bacterium]|nr:DUF4384 domain-containing protein [Deltaproteobacteria bacterium]
MAEREDKEGEAFEVKIMPFSLPARQILNFEHIKVVNVDDKEVKDSAQIGGSIAYERLKRLKKVHKASEIRDSGVAFYFEDCPPDRIKGPSAGLCFLVKMAQEVIEDFLKRETGSSPSYDFAATGEIKNPSSDDKIRAVGFIKEKMRAALAVLGNGGTVFYPKANDPLDPDLHQKAAQKRLALVAGDEPQQIIDFLLKKYFPPKPPPPDGKWLKRILLVCLTVIIMGDKPLLPVPSVEAALFYEGKKSEAIQLPEGKALTQRDGFRVRITPDRTCFLYVFEVDGKHHISWMFPPHPQLRPLPRTVYWIPGNDLWVELDEVKGEETILIWATTSPSPWLEDRRESIDRSEDLPASERLELKKQLEDHLKDEQQKQHGTLRRLTFQHG